MRTTTIALTYVSVCLSSLMQAEAQNLKTFNQNASGSNHTRLSFSISPFVSTPIKKNSDSLLFRGTGNGIKMDADYFVGHFGIGMSSGFGTASADEASINNFIKSSGTVIDLPEITKSRQQNGFILLGPAVRVGDKIAFEAHAKGGLFMNSASIVNIQQRGAQKIIYRNEPTDKTANLGFMTGVKTKYSTNSDMWSFGIAVDYLNTSTEVNNYDARRNGAIPPLRLSKNISDLVAGLSISYNIGGGSRQNGATERTGRPGKTKFGNIIMRTQDNVEGKAPAEIATSSATLNSANASMQGCGPVKQTITNPDGTKSMMEFSCPADAITYVQQVGQTGTTARQTPNANFGEKVNAGKFLHKENIVHRDLAARTVISGQLAWISAENGGVTTNKTISRQTQGASFGERVRMGVHDNNVGNGTNEKKKYGLFFSDGGDIPSSKEAAAVAENPLFEAIAAPNENIIAARMSSGGGDNPLFEQSAGASAFKTVNPLYEPKGQSGTNPLNTSKLANVHSNPLYKGDKSAGLSKVTIALVDNESGATIAVTQTEADGDFYFANVTDGDYSIRINSPIINVKRYGIEAKSNIDLMGMVEQGMENIQLLLNIERIPDSIQRKAGISTSRSNIIRTISMVDESADQSGDGGAANRPGNPIGGIIVKGGKNPGGSFKTVNTDKDGIFEYMGLEPGKYLIQTERTWQLKDNVEILIEEQQAAPASPAGKVKEKASSGLKDTLKTQV